MALLQWVAIAVVPLMAFLAAGHAVLYKRDPRAAFGWVAVCLVFPVAGPIIYFLFGINRVHTRARKLDRLTRWRLDMGYERTALGEGTHLAEPELPAAFVDIAKVSNAVTRRPLVHGNTIEDLENGEQAYPAMLESIEGARKNVYLSTYIFQADTTGRRFVDALARAVSRGVDVRVIVDGFGELYSLPRRVGPMLEPRGIRFVRFLPPTLVPPTLYLNLRTHRKLLITDSTTGYTGGMNIADRHLVESPGDSAPVHDVHFRVRGPVVAQMHQAFLEDWAFCTGEGDSAIFDPDPAPMHSAAGSGAICRTITDGPNEDLEKLAAVMLGAIASARDRIMIVTPYFLPSREMISALQTAALRGVHIAIILPGKSNLPYVHWAMRKMLWELLERDIRIYYQPPPFVHTKLFVVDDFYAHIGSSNIDPRSLRLNFEIAVEIFDQGFVRDLCGRIEAMRARSRSITLQEIDGRPLLVRARDAVAWLFSPYL